MQGKLYIIAGPTAVGKGTLVSELSKDNSEIWVSVSATTREARQGEKNNIHYIFIKKSEFEEKIKSHSFLEYAKVHGNYYGTIKENVFNQLKQGKKVILEIDVQGARQITQEKIKPYKLVKIFVLPKTTEVLKERIEHRGTESSDEIKKRLSIVKKEIAEAKNFDYKIINDDLSIALKELKKIILK